jgi:hypothetical protein
MGYSRDRASGERGTDARAAGERRRRAQAEDGVLALQRSAGNRAVSALLARDGAKPKEDDKRGAAGSPARVTLPGIGVIALLSVNFGGASAPGSTDRGGEGKTPPTSEIHLSSKLGEHSPQLSKALIDGKPMDVEVVMAGGKSTMRLKLGGAIVSGYSTSGSDAGAIESWTLSFQSLEHTVDNE